jgi:hypothetical protein
MSRVLRMVVGLAVPVMLVAAATKAWAASWQLQSSPNPSSTENYLNAVTATSSTNAWAVGTYDNANGVRRTLVEHYDGTSWQKVASPNVGSIDSELNGTRAASSGNVWAVGFYGDSNFDSHPLIEHYDGTSWSVSSSPDQVGVKLQAVGTSSSTNAWAVGYGGPAGAFSERYDGSNWTIVSSPTLTDGQFWGVTTTSSSNAWAVGYYMSNQHWKTLLEHYDGTGWTKVSSPNKSSSLNYLNAVSANSSSDIWAVGEYVRDTDQKLLSLILHYDGTSWKLVSHPDRIYGDYLIAVKGRVVLRRVGGGSLDEQPQ